MTPLRIALTLLAALAMIGVASAGLWQGHTAQREAQALASPSDGQVCTSCTLRHQRLQRDPANND